MHKRFKIDRSLFIATIIVVFGFLSIAFFSRAFTAVLNKHNSEKAILDIQASLDAELGDLARHAKDLASSEVLKSHLLEKDRVDLLAFSVEESRKHGIDGILISDENGKVLARSYFSFKRGDYIYETTKWGVVVARGQSVATVEAGAATSLVVVAGEPVFSNGKFLGGLFTAYIPNPNYLARFKTKHLRIGTEVAFLDKDGIMVDSSFDKEEDRKILAAYFQNPSDLVQHEGPKAVTIGGVDYASQRIPLMGIGREVGSMLVFQRSQQGATAIILAAILTLLFLFVEILLHQRLFLPARKAAHGVRLSLYALVIFSLMFFSINKVLEKGKIELQKPDQLIYNSTMAFEPEFSVLDRSSEQKIAIRLSTGGEAINIVKVVVKYNPRLVRVQDIIFNNSFCDPGLIVDRSIDNELGTVSIICGLPTPGFSEPVGIVADLLIQPLRDGTFLLEFDSQTQVLANDGLGTNVLRSAISGSYRVVQSGVPTVVFSATHPNSARWYNSPEIIFNWRKRPGFSYRYSFSDDPKPPSQTTFTSEEEMSFKIDKDGIYYFFLQTASADSQNISSYIVQVDKTPPQAPHILVSESTVLAGGLVRFHFTSRDNLSGLQKNYYVRINNGIFLPVSQNLFIPFSEPGRYTVVVRVFDNANNYSDSSVQILVEK